MPKKITVIAEKKGHCLVSCGPHQEAALGAWLSLLQDKTIVNATYEVRRHDKTRAQLGYYYAVVLPHVKQGLIDAGHDELISMKACGFDVGLAITNEHVDLLLKSLYQTSKGFEKLPMKRDMSDEQMSEFIDWSIRWTAENLNTAVPPPGELTW